MYIKPAIKTVLKEVTTGSPTFRELLICQIAALILHVQDPDNILFHFNSSKNAIRSQILMEHA